LLTEHTAELPIVFGTHDLFRGNSTELEFQTSYSMEGEYMLLHTMDWPLIVSAFWTSFTTDSLKAPVDHTGLAWPKYTGRNGSIIVFGNETASQVKPVAVMDEVYPLDSC
jgi:hypothetical protein